ncbi:flagellar basal body-associated protein FliL [Aestuariibacter sp. A3R04]|uniref:flagellar basal body-associated FliL family protein n=1 Tax=Aestuariibacter sp. A3R04 TaxID=2841571 RepID=UPI001C08021B|nr:flagellar basal body-associated FliL family protein [Aestuariibacter sp. A3R04]MBU3023129.1 flagellar basal body-associated FliL family protein [Aestuariibacter sp. A3R04]
MKIVIAIIVALLLAVGGVAAGAYYSKNNESKVVSTHVDPLFFPMDRFIVSVGSDGYSRYLVLDLSLATKDPQFFGLLKKFSPLLRNVLVKHFANINREQAKSMFADIIAVQEALLEEFNTTLLSQGVDTKLDQVLVTNVFIQ